jgi:hypothetical protein
MSIVAIRDGVIAADSMGTGGGLKVIMRKLMRQGNVAIGWTGNWVDGKAFADWYFAGADLDKIPALHNRKGSGNEVDFWALVLRPDRWEYWFEWMIPETNQDILVPFYAIGSGTHAAMAAMHMGVSAVEAVEVACAVVNGCGLPVVHEVISAEPNLHKLEVK